MKVAVFSTKPIEKEVFERENVHYHHELVYFETVLNEKTAPLTQGFDAVSCFVSDSLDAGTLERLHRNGIRLIVLRSAGYNHVDVDTAHQLGITIARVPNYSPYAVAEFAVGLMLMLNRKIHRAYQWVRDHNFLLNHLMGFDMHGKTVGIIGTGRIGAVLAKIMHGFGCQLIAYDKLPNPDCLELGVRYVTLEELCRESDIISLHCPLTTETHYLLNTETIAMMKKGVMVINTGRGALIDTKAMIQGLKEGKIGYLGLDVYEEEGGLFFQDLSEEIIQDETFLRLQTFPNVVVTSHQAFFTREALNNIINTTLMNLSYFEEHADMIAEHVV
jgi:D-lactate dehydrogenase